VSPQPQTPLALKKIEIIGNELALLWSDDREDYFTHHFLRLNSPSAENIGERDLTGGTFLPTSTAKIPEDVRITGWQPIGGYAIQLHFSDGHRTGLYSFDYLRRLGDALRSAPDIGS
jgi:DUF971 family protein